MNPGVFDFTRFKTVTIAGEEVTLPDFIVEEPDYREGRQEGAKAGARAALLRFLRRRFAEVGELVERRIESIDDLETIEKLAEEAAVAPTLEAFVALMPPCPQ